MEIPYSANYPLFSEVERSSFRADPLVLRARIEALRATIKAGGERVLCEVNDIRWRTKADFAGNFIAKIDDTIKKDSAGISATTLIGESKFGKRRRVE